MRSDTKNSVQLKTGLANFMVLVACVASLSAGPVLTRIQSAFRAALPSSGSGVISVKFVANATPMGTTEVAGVVPASNWNNANSFDGNTPLALADANGNATGATIVWTADNLHSLPIADQPGNARMMRSYLDTHSGNATHVTVSGLPATTSGYSVYVYADGDNGTATRSATYQISGSGITTTSIGLTDAANTNFSGAFTQANGSSGN